MKTKAVILAIALCSIQFTHAQTTWQGGASNNNWSNGANWSGGVPGPSSNVVIPGVGGPLLDVNATIGSLTLRDSARIFENADDAIQHTLTVSGSTTLEDTGEIGDSTFQLGGGAIFTLGTLTNLSAAGVLTGDYGVYDNDGVGSAQTIIQFRNANVLENRAQVYIAGGPGAAIRDQDTGENAFRNMSVNSWLFYLEDGVVLSTSGNLTNQGDLYLFDTTTTALTQYTVNGALQNTTEGFVDVYGGAKLIVTGDLNNSGGGRAAGVNIFNNSRAPAGETTVTVGGNVHNAADAQITVDGLNGRPARLSIGGNLTNSGSILLGGIGSLEVGGVVTVGAGTLVMNGDPGAGNETFRMVAERIDLAAGTRFGARGTIFADLIGGGVFAPGASPGAVTIQGDLTMTETAVLEIEIGGLSAGTEYDRITQITPTGGSGVVLGGALNISLTNNFLASIQPSDSFVILTSDRPLAGRFNNVAEGGRLITTDGAGSFKVSYNGGEVTLSEFQAATTFTVNTASDTDDGACNAGHCSLREAINAANNSVGLDLIAFSIPGAGPHTITLTAALPTITDPVVIDGYTQPGAMPNTNASGALNAVLKIELNGTSVGTSANGLTITAGDSTVRGLVINRLPAGQNFSVTQNGVSLLQKGGNKIEGNFIGTDVAGTAVHGNAGHAVRVGDNSGANTIGGTSAAARNLLSGNLQGVDIDAGSANIVQGNLIGTDISGTADLGNRGDGIEIAASANNTVGGTTAAARNVIAGNTRNGIAIALDGATGNVVRGNFIGTNGSGTTALPNGEDGISIGAPNNTVGGTVAGAGNLISGNGEHGVEIADVFIVPRGNVVQGNLIGTDAAGAGALANSSHGVLLAAPDCTIGGPAAGARNVISGNSGSGIYVTDPSTTNNQISGNLIGRNAANSGALGNGGHGIALIGSGPNNIGGGFTPNNANVIAHNGGDGIAITFANSACIRKGISENSIFGNGGLGIDLEDDGVTPNDVGDGDTGANEHQNYPVLTSAEVSGGSVTINGTLNSKPSTSYRIEFFSNAACDPSGFGEGQTFLGSANVTTDSNGNATIDSTFASSVAAGNVVTATATDPLDNSSEFSQCVTVTAPPSTPTPTPTPQPTPTPTATATPSPTATATPTPTATATPSPTASPTPAPSPTPLQLLNIATRLRVQTGENVLIGGLIVTGEEPKKVIIRAVGPSLAAAFDGVLADTTLELYQGETLLAQNDNWKDTQQAEIEETTIPPNDDLESAIVYTLQPGSYTAVVSGKDGRIGIGVVEVYDLDQAASSKLANIASRGLVERGENVMIGGLIVGGNGTEDARILLRAIGPSLGQGGVAGALQDPTLELRDTNGELLRENDNWRESQQDEIEATSIPPSDDAESAIITTLPPGNYTAVVRGKNDSAGVGLVEVYNVN